mmetsp:Transcript_33330/g.91213  ORF Transcript_33330/g.91213 Transcript_33330/m.91213 type:complete len:95 (+) Transcript_33330:306-590(+)
MLPPLMLPPLMLPPLWEKEPPLTLPPWLPYGPELCASDWVRTVGERSMLGLNTRELRRLAALDSDTPSIDAFKCSIHEGRFLRNLVMMRQPALA